MRCYPCGPLLLVFLAVWSSPFATVDGRLCHRHGLQTIDNDNVIVPAFGTSSQQGGLMPRQKNVDTVSKATTKGTARALSTLHSLTFSLMNADTDTEIIAFMHNETLIDLATAPRVNIRANVVPSLVPNVGSIHFILCGGPTNYTRTESNAPYALFGDAGNNDFLPWTSPSVGRYLLTALVYSHANAAGTLMANHSVSFVVERKTGTTAPTAKKAPAAVATPASSPIVAVPLKAPKALAPAALVPTAAPATKRPTLPPATLLPSMEPTSFTIPPTNRPVPTRTPTRRPSTASPITRKPTRRPTLRPTVKPTRDPSASGSAHPTTLEPILVVSIQVPPKPPPPTPGMQSTIYLTCGTAAPPRPCGETRNLMHHRWTCQTQCVAEDQVRRKRKAGWQCGRC